MSWSAPMTAVSEAIFTASQFNIYIRDNLLEQAAAKQAPQGSYFTVTGPNSLSDRKAATSEVNVLETTSSASYTDLATYGPSVTVNTGEAALVWFTAQIQVNSDAAACHASFEVSGSTTIAASDAWCLIVDGVPSNNYTRSTSARRVTGLTPGPNTFTMKYRVGSASGGRVITAGARSIIVLPL